MIGSPLGRVGVGMGIEKAADWPPLNMLTSHE